MKRLIILLYAILILASTIVANAQEIEEFCLMDKAKSTPLKAAARGIFSSLVFPEEPYYAGYLGFRNGEGEALTLAQFKGKVLVVNLWAMWCAPCRAEMADLAQLAKKIGNDDFEVLTINMDKDSVENNKIYEFLDEIQAQNLALYRDEEMEIFKQVRQAIPARGLPFTLILDKGGCAVASFSGAAPWGNEDAVYFIETLKSHMTPL